MRARELAVRAWLLLALGVGLSFVAGCPQPQSATCPSGRICPSPYTCAAGQDICILGNCGNGVIDMGEKCDDGNVVNDDQCNSTCSSDNICGNGIIDNTFSDATRNEVCDDGSDNGKPGHCSSDCKSNGLCGNGQRDNGEDCDYCIADDLGDGSASDAAADGSVDGDAGDAAAEAGASGLTCSLGITESRVCNNDCTTARCGDRKINRAAGEQCDDGGESRMCNVDCTVASCGDGKVNRTSNEECDVVGGGDTANCNGTSAASAGVACHFRSAATATSTRQSAPARPCDAANGADTKDCNGAAAGPGVACRISICGDGYVNKAAGETCDILGGVDTKDCNGAMAGAVACHVAQCGDGYVNRAAGESCEVGASGADTTACNGFLAGPDRQCTTVTCGDGYINGTAGETCEVGKDGLDTLNCNGANAGAVKCHKVACGDGYINSISGETCEVATGTNGADTVRCNGTAASAVGLQCRGALCGDGYINGAAGETCDVAGGGDTSGCNGTAAGSALQCQKPSCGDGYLNTKATEACDDKNTTSGDGCSSPTCQIETGFICPTPGQACHSTCGDGKTLGNELCDDFNSNACGTCSATCMGLQTATPAIGSITAVSAGNLVNGETFTLSDGVRTVVFEFNSGAPTDATHVQIIPGNNTQSPGMATKITNAINGVGAALAISAVVNNNKSSQVLLTNGSSGSSGNVKAKETVANASFVVVGMSGGSGFDCPAATGCGGNDDCQSGVCCLGTPGTAACPCPTSGGSCASFVQNTCLAASCNDSVTNGTETDLNLRRR